MPAEAPEDDRNAKAPLPSQLPPFRPIMQVHTPFSDLGVRLHAKQEEITRAYVQKRLRIDPDPDDPHSADHELLAVLDEAVAILREKLLRRALHLCIHKANGNRNIRPWHLLEIQEGAGDDEVEEAYELRMGRWTGYEERYVILMERAYTDAHNWMCERNARRDSMSPRTHPATFPAPPAF